MSIPFEELKNVRATHRGCALFPAAPKRILNRYSGWIAAGAPSDRRSKTHRLRAPKSTMKAYVAIPVGLRIGNLTDSIGISEAKLPKSFTFPTWSHLPRRPLRPQPAKSRGCSICPAAFGWFRCSGLLAPSHPSTKHCNRLGSCLNRLGCPACCRRCRLH